MFAFLFQKYPSVPLLIVHVFSIVPVAYLGYKARYFPKRIERAKRLNPEVDHYLNWKRMVILLTILIVLYGGNLLPIALEGEPSGFFGFGD